MNHPRRVTFAFSPSELGRTEETQPLNGALLSLNPVQNVPDADRFSEMGSCGIVPFRVGIVRLATMKLVGSGLVAFVCAQRAANDMAAFGCSLAAAVNAVAVLHYAIICTPRPATRTRRSAH